MPKEATQAPLVAPLSGTTRVEAFSDGVMAIAITLLILEVKVPHLGAGESLLQGLLRLWPTLLAYLASFLTIGIIWLNHHAFFGRLRSLDNALRWWNLMLLLGVSFLPFPTSVLAEYAPRGDADARVAAALYGLVGVLMTAPWIFMWQALMRNPALMEAGRGVAHARAGRARAAVGLVAYAACIGVAMVAPVVALVLYLAVAVFYAITSHRGEG